MTMRGRAGGIVAVAVFGSGSAAVGMHTAAMMAVQVVELVVSVVVVGVVAVTAVVACDEVAVAVAVVGMGWTAETMQESGTVFAISTALVDYQEKKY